MRESGVAGAARQIQLRKAVEAKFARSAECEKEIDLAHSSILKNQEEYDKQLLTLSAGFLAITVTFIKDVVKMDQASYRPVLYSAWVILIVCIVAVLISYQISNAGLEKGQLYWQNQKNGDGQMPFPYEYAKRIKRWNYFSGTCFLLGIALILLFVVINLHKEATHVTEANSIAGRPSNEGSCPRGRCSKGGNDEGTCPASSVHSTSTNTAAKEVTPSGEIGMNNKTAGCAQDGAPMKEPSQKKVDRGAHLKVPPSTPKQPPAAKK